MGAAARPDGKRRGGTVAQEFAINHPGLFAAVATLHGVAFEAAYRKGDEPSEALFQSMRGKTIAPIWKQKKREVPETVWMFESDTEDAAVAKQASYWRKSLGAGHCGQENVRRLRDGGVCEPGKRGGAGAAHQGGGRDRLR